MRHMRRGLMLSIALAATVGCNSQPATSAAPAVEGEAATVRFVNVETGCWVLETNAGRVQPIDLPESFRVDGLQVNVLLRDAPAMMSLCQVGPLKTVEKITKRS